MPTLPAERQRSARLRWRRQRPPHLGIGIVAAACHRSSALWWPSFERRSPGRPVFPTRLDSQTYAAVSIAPIAVFYYPVPADRLHRSWLIGKRILPSKTNVISLLCFSGLALGRCILCHSFVTLKNVLQCFFVDAAMMLNQIHKKRGRILEAL